MTPRPRETSDAEILAAAARVMQRISPVDLTLADVAKEAGIVPATIIQRFGTKRELLLANCKAWTADVAGRFAAARAQYGSPLKTLIEMSADCSSFAATPESMANFLAYLQIDLTDPEFHAVLLRQYTATHDETRKLLDDAIAAHELKPCDTADLARLVQQTNGGAMLDWAIYRKGSLASWIRSSLKALLLPYSRSARRRIKRRGLYDRVRGRLA
ncbi:MAG TPA: helix-turn-helix domain-containing protein [Candidatus Eremiobacteraceae bacterium]|nr:helix-turn-helix domain-containing protein [Candidatus Eremiobacteraceae bacterium]